jgi:hypothetical protein
MIVMEDGHAVERQPRDVNELKNTQFRLPNATSRPTSKNTSFTSGS